MKRWKFREPARTRYFAFVAAAVVSSGVPLAAYAVSSVQIGSAALISPDVANGTFPLSGDATHTFSTGTTTRPDEIIELARALNNNVDQIYDFVRNNVNMVWMYGQKKGALGALVDRSGTAFDQAHLMVELLRQSGNASAGYQVGTITLTGAQFSAWTGITNAVAACQLLASGGIPATVNGSSGVACSAVSGTVSTVELAHAWVSAQINGTTYFFDPSYKAYSFKPGINVGSAAGLVSGQPLTRAGTGMSSGTASGTPYVVNLGAESLDSQLQTYGNNLLTYIQQNYPSGEIEDIVGGAQIQRYEAPSGGLRQTALPYPSTVHRSWAGEIPDQYRTSLRLQITKAYPDATRPQIIDRTLFADDIYGRKLNLFGTFASTGSSTAVNLQLLSETGSVRSLFSQTFTNHSGGLSVGTVTLSVNHPYAASADGSATPNGSYMDAVVTKRVRYSTPLTIVHGWGDTDRRLIEKWGSRNDGVLPNLITGGCETCNMDFYASNGAGRREQIAASWLAQSSRAARLHAALAGSIYALHHSIGVVAGDSVPEAIDIDPSAAVTYRWIIVDSFDRLDVDSAFSLTNKVADAATRRAAVHAIAETMEALEGSVCAQIADLPDTASIATRFEWGNRPPTTEDPSGGAGPRRFYEFNSTNASLVQSLAKVEGQTSTTNDGIHFGNDVELGTGDFATRKSNLQSAVNAYANAGFMVVTSEEAFLGPGQRGGAFYEQGAYYAHRDSKQRGGALIATRYVAGEPVEIAHVTVGTDAEAKGGGAGAQPGHQAQYDPSQAADILKSRFVDRSKQLGVDLQSGALSVQSPASISVGNGGFPYELTASLLWVGGNQRPTTFGPVAHTEPDTPWTTNWNNTLTVSGSGSEMLGDGDLRATAGTLAAFIAAQDVYKSSPTIHRDVTGALIGAWWVRQLTGNVVTANVGTQTRQFVKLIDDSWISTDPGSFATLTQTGSRVVYTESGCRSSHPTYVLTRGWNYAGLAFQIRNVQGDVQNFSYWTHRYQAVDSTYCAQMRGFRLSNWSFPQGVTINLVYSTPSAGQVPELVEVNNSLGRKLSFVNSGRGGFSNGLVGSDARSVTVLGDPLVPGTVTHVEPSGANNRFVFTAAGERYLLNDVYTADNANVPAVRYTYDRLRRVMEVRDAVALRVGGRNPYRFRIAEGIRGERMNPANGRYVVLFDKRKRGFRHIDEIGRATNIEYDGRGRPVKYVYPENDQEIIAYDNRNNPTTLTKVAKPGSGLADITVRAQWNATWNKPDWIVDGRNNQTDFSYHPNGNGQSLLMTVTRPAPTSGASRPVYGFTYNSRGQLLTTTDPTNLVVSNTYDSATGNLLTTSIDPSAINSITRLGYDAIGNVTSVTDPRLYVTEQFYDNNRRRYLSLHHNGDINSSVIAAERTNFDLLGQVTSEEVGISFSGITVSAWQTLKSFTYTDTGKVYTERNGAGNTIVRTYDAADRLVEIADPVNRRTRFDYDAASQLLTETRAYGTALQQPYARYTYFQNGQVNYVRDANNNRTTFVYDGFDRLRRIRYPSPTLGANSSSSTDYEEYGYDNNGNRISVRRRDGQTILFSYDALNREIVKDLPGGTTEDVYSEYDLAGRPLSRRFSSTTGSGIVYDYDTARRVTSETSFGRSLSYGYDTANNRTRLIYPDGNYVSYEYDALNRLTYVRENGASSGVGVLAQYQYDALSRRGPLTRGNGTVTGYGYDAASRLTALSHDLPGTAYDVNIGFGYTDASQLRARSIDNSALGWWTAPDRLHSYVANGLNRYTSLNGVSYTYDARGNLTGDGARTFAYNAENRLISVSGASSLVLTYDPNGRLRQTAAGSAVTQYLYDGDRLTAEYDGAGNVLRRYVHGAGVDEPIVWYEGSGLSNRRWLHSDERGSVIGSSDAASNVAAYNYGPYGEQSSWSGSRFRYTGQIMLPEVQLYHYKARVYDPAIGRFLQTDPVGYGDDVNLYAYVKNDPLNNTDPNGEVCIPCITAVVGAGFGAAAEGIRQYKEGKFDGAKLLAATAKGGLIGLGAGAGGAAAMLVKGADAFTVVAGSAIGAGVADLTTSQAVDVMTGQKSVSDVKLGESEILGALGTAALEVAGVPGGRAGAEVADGVKALAAGTHEAARSTSTQVGTAVGSNAGGTAAGAIAKDVVCSQPENCGGTR